MASSLVKKLGIQPGQRVLVVTAPAGYVELLTDRAEGVTVATFGEDPFDFVHLFVKHSAEYADLSPIAFGAVTYDGLLWISYPKKSSNVETDLTRDVLWRLTADTGLRAVTQVSINSVWSAMRFRPSEKVGK